MAARQSAGWRSGAMDAAGGRPWPAAPAADSAARRRRCHVGTDHFFADIFAVDVADGDRPAVGVRCHGLAPGLSAATRVTKAVRAGSPAAQPSAGLRPLRGRALAAARADLRTGDVALLASDRTRPTWQRAKRAQAQRATAEVYQALSRNVGPAGAFAVPCAGRALPEENRDDAHLVAALVAGWPPACRHAQPHDLRPRRLQHHPDPRGHAKAKWADVQNNYQRRADLVPTWSPPSKATPGRRRTS